MKNRNVDVFSDSKACSNRLAQLMKCPLFIGRQIVNPLTTDFEIRFLWFCVNLPCDLCRDIAGPGWKSPRLVLLLVPNRLPDLEHQQTSTADPW